MEHGGREAWRQELGGGGEKLFDRWRRPEARLGSRPDLAPSVSISTINSITSVISCVTGIFNISIII